MKSLLSILLFGSILFADVDYKIENSNIQVNEAYSYNYNRLRLNLNYAEDQYFTTMIADGVNYYGKSYIDSTEFALFKTIKSDTPVSTQTNFKDYGKGETYAKLYRLYGGYEDNKNRLSIGLQNITMGVGRFWNPTNLFNPKNIYAIEPDETFGVTAMSYTRHMSDASDLSLIGSIRDDKSFKYAARFKSFLEQVEVGINLLVSDQTKMVGYELEANLFDTGVEVRSEGAYISSKLNFVPKDTEFYQAVFGADYGFVNGVNLTVESLYSSKEFNDVQILSNLNSEIIQNMTNSKFYAGASLSYTFNIFLDGSILYIDSFDSYDPFSSATLTYTLNDYNSFIIGVMAQDDETYYLKWQLSF
ncbi:hypothetical protein [Sulfurimonas sp.]|uniref:hypothetical protein n=1 Tax=Sulfurimonas sp. TaxID=2022749 RepID=UPI003568A68A